MTGRVHVLSKPPEHARHKRCLKLLDPEDTLVLTEAGLQLLAKPDPMEGINAGWVVALTEPPETLTRPDNVGFMDHATFVEKLLARHQPVFW